MVEVGKGGAWNDWEEWLPIYLYIYIPWDPKTHMFRGSLWEITWVFRWQKPLFIYFSWFWGLMV